MSSRIIREYKKADIPLFKIPRSCQDIIDVVSIAKDGVFFLGQGKYSKLYELTDINYSMFTDEEQNSILQKFCEFLNSMEVQFKFLFLNSYRDFESYEDKYLIPEQGDAFDTIRKEHNDNIISVLQESNNTVDLSKYLMLVVERNNVEAARAYFATVENNVIKQLKKIGSSIRSLKAEERLELLYKCYNPASDVKPDFSFEDMMANFKNYKDFICPSSIKFIDGEKIKNPHVEVNNNRIMKAYYIRDYSSHISDEMIKDMLGLGYEMIISEDVSPIPKDRAVEFCNSIYMRIEDKISKIQQKHNKNQAYSSDIPFLIRKEKSDMEKILEKLNKNQNLFYVGFTILLIAPTIEDLEKAETALRTFASAKTMKLEEYKMKQRKAFNTCLPIGVRQVSNMRTFLSNDLVALLPFDSFNIMDETGVFWGSNSLTKDIIMIDRKKLLNGHGVILGTSGAGKSMLSKDDVEEVFFRYPEDKIIIIDPQGEYRSLADALKGAYIDISAKSKTYVNPFEISEMEQGLSADELARNKADLALGICENGCDEHFSNKHKSIVSRCLKLMYAECLDSNNHIIKQPLLEDFSAVVAAQTEKEARDILLCMELYTTGVLNVFNHHSNVDAVNSRLTIFGLSELGDDLANVGLTVMMDYIMSGILKDFQKGIATHVFFDEFHELAGHEYCGRMVVKHWKEDRKLGALLTGITQQATDLLDDPQISKIISNSEFVVLLKQKDTDKDVIADTFGIPDVQMNYCMNNPPGTGLIKVGDNIVAFDHTMEDSNPIYKRYNTNFHEINKLTG